MVVWLKEELDYDVSAAPDRLLSSRYGLLPPSLTMGTTAKRNVTTKRTRTTALIRSFTAMRWPGPGCTGVAGAVQPGPHVVSRAGSLEVPLRRNGNVLSGGREGGQFSHTPYDLPAEMKSLTNARKVRYEYGPNRKKIRRLNFANLTATSTNDVVALRGSAEVHWRPNGSVEARRYAGPSWWSSRRRRRGRIRSSASTSLTDALGSTFRGTDGLAAGERSMSMSFEPFGARRDPILGHVLPWWASGLTSIRTRARGTVSRARATGRVR